MFRWKLILRDIFGLRRQQPKPRRLRRTMRPHLEVLEDRTLLSGSPILDLDGYLSGQAPSLSPSAATTAPAIMPTSAPTPTPSPSPALHTSFSAPSDPGGSSVVTAGILLQSSRGADFSSSVRGTVGGGLFTFTGAVTYTYATSSFVNPGDAVSGSISGFSGDSFSGNDNFNLTDETTGSSFLNGGAAGYFTEGFNTLSYIGRSAGLPDAQGPGGSQ